MLLVIDHHNGVPAYRQIMDQIKLQIAAGVLPAGTEMASTRGLSAELTLNPMTISKAYGLLEHEGVLERRRGQTLVVRARPAGDAANQQARASAPASRQRRRPGPPARHLARAGAQTFPRNPVVPANEIHRP
jgi:DNA-binding transcriptional regulator YhcF (GntR family)